MGVGRERYCDKVSSLLESCMCLYEVNSCTSVQVPVDLEDDRWPQQAEAGSSCFGSGQLGYIARHYHKTKQNKATWIYK